LTIHGSVNPRPITVNKAREIKNYNNGGKKIKE